MLYNNKLVYAAVLAASSVFAQDTDSTGGTTLLSTSIQEGSEVDGSEQIGNAEVGQAKSLTSTNNFINFCSGKTLTNGLQIITGSCNGIVMGDIPAKTAMVSSVITFPQTGQTINSDTDFNITVQMSGIVPGSFTNADATYYAAPQQLQGGFVVGHTHVTVQDLGGDMNPTQALDPTLFSFFKGINDAGNGQGLLSAPVVGGLPAGNYRVCTLASASNHQPVLMPVAQRGTADDCTKFQVTGDGTTINVGANDGTTGIAAAAEAAEAVSAGPGAIESTTAAAVVASSTSAGSASATGASTSSAGSTGGNTGNQGGFHNFGNGGGRFHGGGEHGGRRHRFARRQYIA